MKETRELVDSLCGAKLQHYVHDESSVQLSNMLDVVPEKAATMLAGCE